MVQHRAHYSTCPGGWLCTVYLYTVYLQLPDCILSAEAQALPTRCIEIYEAGIVITRVWICVCVLSVYLSICEITHERGDGCCPAWYTWARLQLALKKCANQNLFPI